MKDRAIGRTTLSQRDRTEEPLPLAPAPTEKLHSATEGVDRQDRTEPVKESTGRQNRTALDAQASSMTRNKLDALVRQIQVGPPRFRNVFSCVVPNEHDHGLQTMRDIERQVFDYAFALLCLR